MRAKRERADKVHAAIGLATFSPREIFKPVFDSIAQCSRAGAFVWGEEETTGDRSPVIIAPIYTRGNPPQIDIGFSDPIAVNAIG